MPGILDTVTKVVEVVTEAFAGPVIPALVDIGKGALKLIDEVKTTVNLTDQDALQAMRDKLEPLVMAHADATEKALRGSE